MQSLFVHWFRVRFLIAALAVAPSTLAAQAAIPQFRGDVGVRAGTIAPPGVSFTTYFNNYQARRARNGDGDSVDIVNTIQTVLLQGTYSSNFTILGARYAATVMVPWVSMAPETVNRQLTTHWGYGDMYLQPLQLGWSFPKADVLFGQAVYLPTGRFTAGAPNNSGYGMWSYETTAGLTGYADSARTRSASTILAYQVQSTAQGTDRRAGQVLLAQGGIGQDISWFRGHIGAVYYARWKLSHDDNFLLPLEFQRDDRFYAFGLELASAVISRPAARLTLTSRFYFEGGNRSALEGDSFIFMATVYAPQGKARPRP